MPEREMLREAEIVVVKIGTSVLTGGRDRLDAAYLHDIGAEIARLTTSGRRVVLVSSGAVGAGLGVLGLDRRPTDLGQLQGAAAAGQPELIRLWRDAFAVRDVRVAQVLVGRSDFDARDRFLNIRNCLTVLLERGVVPIVNENDAVATEEIALGDNDVLASKVAHAAHADALVILTSAPGVQDASGAVVERVTGADELLPHVRTDRTSQGRGGMSTKVEAARAATRAGVITVIAPGRPAESLGAVMRGERVGTLVAPRTDRPRSRDAWLALAATPSGAVIVDEGAVRALRERGASLLPKGVVRTTGDFGVGDVVTIETDGGAPIARGLTNLARHELERVKGLATHELASALGRRVHDEVVHRDNMVLLAS
ncbi:MAG: glutamate 5-kinase [Phycisphaerales bacterium]